VKVRIENSLKIKSNLKKYFQVHLCSQGTLYKQKSCNKRVSCPYIFNISYFQNGEFEWNEETQGYILSAYYYGYVATQLLGGRLSEMFGSKVVLGPGVLISGLMSLLYPVASRLNVGAFIAVRVLTGAASVSSDIIQCFV
jgi:hypothetical protein